jgi:hypothetical protein
MVGIPNLGLVLLGIYKCFSPALVRLLCIADLLDFLLLTTFF